MCGIFGIAGHSEASNLTYLGLYALQHRGQEAAGIVSTDGKKTYRMRRRSLVSDAFEPKSFDFLKGSMAIGHVRYATTGDHDPRNVQPCTSAGEFGSLSVAHNGNLTNFKALRKRLEQEGSIFQGTMDTEVIPHLVAKAEGATIADKIVNGLKDVEGAYSLLFLSEREMIAVRDPMGFRPLCMGRLNGSVVFSSETCAFDLIDAKYERDVEPGEMVIISRDGHVESRRIAPPARRAACVFEHIYFARPDSLIFTKNVYDVRKRLGRELAREFKVSADMVVPVPDSGVITAIGYSEESKIPLEMGFIRNHYIGRTFIEPKQSIRGLGVKVKLNPVPGLLKGKNLVVIDDSIVRGTTSKKIIKMLREAGAGKITLLISSPSVTGPCFYGIDTPTKRELIASNHSLDEIREYVEADELHYLSLDGVYKAVQESRDRYCDACFSGQYPTKLYET